MYSIRNLPNAANNSSPFPIYSRADTLAFLLKFRMPKDMVAQFRAANGQRFRAFPLSKFTRRRGWQQGIILQSPTMAALELAAQIEPSELLPVNLHLCLDHIEPDQESADVSCDFYQKHSIQRHARTETTMQKNTSYSARAIARTRLVIYSTKLCKVTGEHCAHVELRMKGAAKLKKMGLGTIQQIINLDHLAFWEKHWVLIEPKFRTVDEVISAVLARNQYQIKQGKWRHGCGEKRIASLIHRGRITSKDGADQIPTVFPQESRMWERRLLIKGARPVLIDKSPFMPTAVIDNPTTIINKAICHTSSYWKDFQD